MSSRLATCATRAVLHQTAQRGLARSASAAAVRRATPASSSRPSACKTSSIRLYSVAATHATPATEAALPPTLRELLRLHDGSESPPAKKRVHAWVHSVRSHRKVSFLSLTDGTLPADVHLQAVVPSELLSNASTAGDDGPASAGSAIGPGTAVRLVGELVQSRGNQQAVELKVESLEVLGGCEAATYPLANPQQLTSDTIRKLAHLRARTRRFAAVLRSRHALLRGLEGWFDSQDFLRVTTPIMTSSDCEGAGEVFQVIADSDAAQVFAGQLSREGQESSGPLTSAPELAKDLTSFFSNTSTYLTVSAQLHLEAVTALAHPRTYTIAPAFRAEGSATSRHLGEFWMCEAEVAWIDTDSPEQPGRALEQTMAVCEQSVKAALRSALGTSTAETSTAPDRHHDADFLHAAESEATGKAEVQSLRHISAETTAPWPKITYSRAIELLMARHQSGSSPFFSIEPVWGQSLASEHERWLASEEGPWKDRADFGEAPQGGPVFVTDFPAEVKAFYMRVNSDSITEDPETRTVACFDLLVPRVGELAGGSVREEREAVLRTRMEEFGLTHSNGGLRSPAALGQLDPSSGSASDGEYPVSRSLDWYARDVRRFGCAPHGGFGIGVERLVSWVTGTESVRDCIPFPRTKGAVRF